MPSVHDVKHQSLMCKVRSYLESHGFILPPADMSVHELLGNKLRDMLANDHSFSSLAIRTRKDCCAYNPKLKIAFQFDAKTNQTADDVFIELVPFASAILNAQFGTETIFCVETKSGKSFGVWANRYSGALVDGLFLFDRFDDESLGTLYSTCHVLFPSAKVYRSSWKRGSGDPSIRIKESTASQFLLPWEVAIEKRLKLGKSLGLVQRMLNGNASSGELF